MSRVYFDHAATTPMSPEAKEAMLPYLDVDFGNATSLHAEGQKAMRAVDGSREIIQKAIGARKFSEIVFTSSATEANNLAIKGIALRDLQLITNNSRRPGRKIHIITTKLEHESVLKPIEQMVDIGIAEVDFLPNDRSGIVNAAALHDLIKENTVLISIIHVVSTLGTIQPIKKIGTQLKALGKKVFFHVDAAQAWMTEQINVQDLGVDLLTVSAHKIYGPKGAAMLYVAGETPLVPLLSGATQEFGVRSSSENVPAIAGFGKAVEILEKNREAWNEHLGQLKNCMIAKLQDSGIEHGINGAILQSCDKILNVYFPKKSAEELSIALDMAGIAVSAGSACHARARVPTPAVLALGYDENRATHSIRFSFGKGNAKDEVEQCVKELVRILAGK